MAQVHSTVIPTMRYRNAPAMIDWLGKVFGWSVMPCTRGPTEPSTTASSNSMAA